MKNSNGRRASALESLESRQLLSGEPLITGAIAGQAVNDNSTITPFAAVTISDDDSPLLSVEVQLDNSSRGVFTSGSLNTSGFSDEGSGRYLYFGSPSEATAAIRTLSYNPTDNRVPVNFSETTRFTITVDDATNDPAVNNTTTVRSISANDAPTLGGFTASTTINDTATATPFSSATIADPDPLQSLTVTVTLDSNAKGVFTPASLTSSGFVYGSGAYTYTGRVANAQAALRALAYDPTNDRSAVGATEITTFSVSVNDGYAVTSDSSTHVTSTSVNDAPTVTGAVASQAVNDNATLSPFSGVTIADVDPGQTLSLSVTIDTAAKGAFTGGSLSAAGFTDAGGGVYTRTGSASALTTAIRALVFAPTENRAAIGSTETSTFTIDADDGVASVVSNSTTTVVSTPYNDASVITGAVSSQAVNDNATLTPFSGVTIADADSPAQTLSVSVSLDAAAKGSFTSGSLASAGFTDAGGGVYTRTGTAAQLTTAIRALVFAPTENRAAIGSTETTTLAISVTDNLIAPVTNSTTTVVSTPFNDAVVIGGATAGQAINDIQTVSPFSGITVSDADIPAQTFAVTVALDTAAKGAFTSASLTSSGFVSAGGGSYTFSGTAAQAQTALRALVFDPTDNRVAVASTETTTFTITVSDGVIADVTNSTTTVVSTSVNVAPTVGGASSGFAVLDNATVQPFTAVTIGDADNDTLDVIVFIDNAAKGAFTPASLAASGFSDAGSGNYTFSGTAAQAQAAIRQLVFQPTENRVLVGSTETSTLTIGVDDSIAAIVYNATTTAVATPFNDPTLITGAVASQAVNDSATLTPFSGVTISDADTPAQTLSISVTLDAAAKGVFTAGSLAGAGFTDAGGGVYTRTGSATALTTAIRTLVYNPANDRVAVGSTETTGFTIHIVDNVDEAVTNTTTTVVSTSMNDAPSVTGAVAGQAVNDTATLSPFSGVSFADVDPGTTLTITVTLDTAAKGVFTAGSLASSGFADAGSGVYTFTGSASQATTAIRALVYDPADNRVTPASTETTTFTIDANDTHTTTSNSTTTAVSTSVNDAPTISGASSAQPVNDNATLTPFAGVTIADVDSPAQTLTLSITLDTAAKGVFTAGSLVSAGFTDEGGGVYSRTGTASALTTAIRALVYNPTNDRVAIGSTETSTFTVSVDDAVASAVTDSTTTVVSTSMNDASTIGGTSAAQPVNDNATLSPFSGATVADTDPGQVLGITVTIDDVAKGVFTSGSVASAGFTDMGSGVYHRTGTASALTTAIRALVFNPADNRVAPASTETTHFELSVDDGLLSPVTDSTTSVVSTSVNDAPVVANTVASQPVNDNATILPFSTVTISDVDTGQTLDVSVTIDTAAKGVFTAGSLSASGFVSAGGGVYTFTGTGAAATTAIRQLVFNPANDRVNVGQTETSTFTISADDSVAAPTTDSTATAVSTSMNDAPTVGGSSAAQPVNDSATLTPFSAVTIGDVDPDDQTLSISITLDTAAKGVFTSGSLAASGFVSAGGGVYTFSGTASAATTAIRQLVFNPTDNRVTPGSTETTGFTIAVDDGSASASDTATTVVSTSMNDAPTATGAVAAQPVNDNATLSPFSGVTIADVDPGQTQTVTVTLDTAAKGVFTPASLSSSGFVSAGGGNYTFTGTAAAATTAIRALVYDPTNNRVAVASTETTTFTIGVDDGASGTASNSTTTVVSTSINDAPSITGAVTGTDVDDNGTVLPFATLTIGDVDSPAQSLDITVTLDAAGKGVFTPGSLSASGFTDAGGGAYTFTGTASAATAAIRQLVFAPTENRVVVGSTETTTFTVQVDDSLASPTTDADSTVIASPYNDPTSITGASAGQAVNDNATVTPFSAVTVSDADSPAQSMTATVTVDSAAKGVFTTASLSASGFVDAGSGTYTFTGTAAQITTAIRQLVFNPTDNRVAVGSTETASFAISVDDGFVAPVQNSTTTVVSTSANDAPSISGAVAGQAVNDTATVTPFAAVTISDADPNQSQLVTVSIDAAAKGIFTPASLFASGFTDAGSGSYTFTGTAAAATAAIRQLAFDPANNRVAANATETGTFTISVNDSVAAPATDATTTVVSTNVNDAPVITGAAADQAVTDVTTVQPFASLTISDADPSTSLDIVVTLDAAAKGVFTPASLSASGFTDAGGGAYTFTGSPSAATTAIRQLVFQPAENRVVIGQTETTTFSISADDSIASPTTNEASTVVSTPHNDATVITGTQSAQAVNDTATLAPFSGVTISDADSPAQTLTVTVLLDNAAKGTFTSASLSSSGFVNAGGGAYTFTGTAAQATTAIRALVFDPADNRVAVGSSETTSLGIEVEDGFASAVADTVTTVVSTSQNNAPTVTGTLAAQPVNDNATINPFAAVTLADADPSTTLSVSVTIDSTAKGTFTSASLTASGFVSAGAGVFTFSGSASAATTAIRALVFDPTENRVAVGSFETTSFSVAISDGVASEVSDTTTTVRSTSINDASTITGAQSAQAVEDASTLTPFAAISFADADPSTTLTVSVTLDASLKGVFTSASLASSGFADAGSGVYTFTGTPTQATTAIRALVFNPTNNRVAVGSTETTTFSIGVSDGSGPVVTNASTTVVSTSVNDAPTISGAQAGQAVSDASTLSPFASVTIADVDPGTTVSVSITIDSAAKGVITTESLAAMGFVDAGSGVYTFSGSPSAATNAIRGLHFNPADNRVPVGDTETSHFTIAISDGVAGAVTDNATTVVSTSSNDASNLSGAVVGQAVNDTASVQPFASFVISDPDPTQTFTVQVTLSAAAQGVMTPASLTASGFSLTSPGVYSFSGSASAAQAAIRQLAFRPTENAVPAGQTQTTVFTVTVSDGTNVATSSTTSVVATSMNDAPVISGALAQSSIPDTQNASPFTGISFSDADPSAALTVTVSLDTAAKGAFTSASLAASGFVDAGSGSYTFAGSPAAATTAIRALVFTPTQNRSGNGQSETTVFTVTASDGLVTATDANTSLPVAGVNQAPTLASVTPSLSAVRTGQTFVLTAAGVADADGSIAGVAFYRDSNASGGWDSGDELLGQGSPVSGGWSFTATASSSWGTGSVMLFARCSDNDGDFSAAASTSVAVAANTGPLVATLSASATSATVGQQVTITATGVASESGAVKKVSFYIDSNGNGIWDSRDKKLGADSKTTDGYSVSFLVPKDWAVGPRMIFAKADAGRSTGDAASLLFNVAANTGPTIAALVASPTTLPSSRKITLSTPDVSDADGSVKSVEYFVDSNFNGIFDAADKKIKSVSSSRGGWAASITATRSWINAGSIRFFARAIDNNKLAGAVVALAVPVAG